MSLSRQSQLPQSTKHLPADLFRFLGEESYAKGQSRDYLIDEHPTWCIDPLDGNNHSHTPSSAINDMK